MTNPITGAAIGAVKGATGQLDAKKGKLESKVASKDGSADAQDIIVNCPEGYTLTAGGFECQDPRDPAVVIKNRPTDDGKAWVVRLAGNMEGDPSSRIKCRAYVVGTRIV